MRNTARTETQLLRVLGPVFGVALGVGGAIGGGILRTPGDVLGSGAVAVIAVIAIVVVAGCVNANIMAGVRVLHGWPATGIFRKRSPA